MDSFLHFLESHMAPCFFKKFTGMDCFGCGFQRSLLELLKGNIVECFELYPPLIPMIFMFAFLGIHVKFSLKYGAQILKYAFIVISIMIVVNFVLKLF